MRKFIPATLAGLTFASASVFAADTQPAVAPESKPASPDNKTVSENKMTTPATPAAFESMEANGQKFVLVCSIKTIEANRQFQQNVQLVQTQLQQVKTLEQRVKDALTLVEKEALGKVLADTSKSLEQNNNLMAKTYGFSILRQYSVEVGKTRLYTPISDEEYTKAKAAADYKEDHFIVTEKAKFAQMATIDGVANNITFQQNVQLVQAQRKGLAQLQQAIDQTKDEGEKTKLKDQFKKSEDVLLKNNEEMTKRYGFSLARNYTMEIEDSKLFMAVTPEEFAKQVEDAKKNGTYKEEAPKAEAAPAAPAAAK